jgi:hypothetical protein
MRIVSRAELMSMPEGTVYSNFEPDIFSGLHVTGGPCGPDFLTCSLLTQFVGEDSSEHFHAICDRLVKGESVPLEFGESFGREGLFDHEMVYAVWEKSDLNRLADLLLQLANPEKELR